MRKAIRGIAKVVWGAYELWGFASWVVLGTLGNIISFLFLPFSQDWHLLLKVLYGIGLFVASLFVSALVIRLRQIVFAPSDEKAISDRQTQSVKSGGSDSPAIGVQAGGDVTGNVFNVGPPTATIGIKPDVVVTTDPEGNYARLQVTNNGSAANFRATAQEDQGGELIGSPWPIRWRGSGNRDMSIHQYDSHILDLALIERVQVRPYNAGQAREEDYQVTVFFITADQSVVGRKTPRGRFKPQDRQTYKLLVTITSDPPMEQPYKRYWVLTRNDGKWGVTQPSLNLSEAKQ